MNLMNQREYVEFKDENFQKPQNIIMSTEQDLQQPNSVNNNAQASPEAKTSDNMNKLMADLSDHSSSEQESTPF